MDGDAVAQNDLAPFDWHEDGVLWLINRVVFHPRGFALTRQRGANPEWTIQGDGTEVWAFQNGQEDRSFAAVEALFKRLSASSPD